MHLKPSLALMHCVPLCTVGFTQFPASPSTQTQVPVINKCSAPATAAATTAHPLLPQVTKEEYATKGAAALGSALVQQLSAEGKRPYYIPVGGSSALGVWGYLQAVEELREQTQQLGLTFDVLASVGGYCSAKQTNSTWRSCLHCRCCCSCCGSCRATRSLVISTAWARGVCTQKTCQEETG